MSVTPRIARVEIIFSENSAVRRPATYRSLADADAALADAFARERPPEGGGYDKTGFMVMWTDGQRHDGRADVTAEDVRTAPAAGGILRQHLLRTGAYLRERLPRYFTGADRAAKIAWGVELLRRLEAEPALGATRNLDHVPDHLLLPIGATSDHLDVSLLPEPFRAVAELEAYFAALRPPVVVWRGHGRTVPRTTNEDVTYAANWLSLALAHDMPRLRELTGRPHGAIWDSWSKAIEHVRRHLGADPDATFRDNQRFWSHLAPHLARMVHAAVDGHGTRNAEAPERYQWKIRYRGPHEDLVTHQLAPDYSSALQAAATSLGFWPGVLTAHRLENGRWRSV